MTNLYFQQDRIHCPPSESIYPLIPAANPPSALPCAAPSFFLTLRLPYILRARCMVQHSTGLHTRSNRALPPSAAPPRNLPPPPYTRTQAMLRRVLLLFLASAAMASAASGEGASPGIMLVPQSQLAQRAVCGFGESCGNGCASGPCCDDAAGSAFLPPPVSLPRYITGTLANAERGVRVDSFLRQRLGVHGHRRRHGLLPRGSNVRPDPAVHGLRRGRVCRRRLRARVLVSISVHRDVSTGRC